MFALFAKEIFLVRSESFLSRVATTALRTLRHWNDPYLTHSLSARLWSSSVKS